jgi:hypothetical protein
MNQSTKLCTTRFPETLATTFQMDPELDPQVRFPNWQIQLQREAQRISPSCQYFNNKSI